MGLFSKKDPVVVDLEKASKELSRIRAEIDRSETMLSAKRSELETTRSQLQATVRELREAQNELAAELNIQSYGLYTPTYDFANSDLYKEELKKVRDLQKNMIKAKTAFTGNPNWTVNGNRKEGQKMIADMQKLLMLAFNSQCDDVVNHVTISNHQRSLEKINKLADSVSKLGRIMDVRISSNYVNLKICEINLALDFAQKKQEEKDRLRELREQQREEAKAQKEIEEAKKKLEKEKAHYQNALHNILDQLANDPENADLLAKKAEIISTIMETNKAIEDVDYRQANIRAGYVYVISNIGAFGENVYKIGMTRRLDPMDRVDELGDASVPFKFDVHALIFTEDAPGLESALHNAFEKQKVNKINGRREFFNVSLDEIKRVVRENFDKTVEWVDVPPAEQYRQSLLMQEGR